MTDGTGAPGPYSQTPYKLVTSTITNVSGTAPAITLTFNSTSSDNKDLQYFQAGDVIQDNSTWNQDQVWSSFSLTDTGTGTSGFDKLFNGTVPEIGDTNFSESWYPNGNQDEEGKGIATGFNIPFSRSVVIRCFKQNYNNSDASKLEIYINDVDVINDIDRGNNQATFELDVTSKITSPIRNIGVERSDGADGNVGLQAIYVDGQLLVDTGIPGNTVNKASVVSTGILDGTNSNTMVVDGGDWDASNQSEVWSDGTTVGSYRGNQTIDKAFNGNPSDFAEQTMDTDLTYTFTTPVPVTLLLRSGRWQKVLVMKCI